jgi:hypothetical protein
MLIPVVSLILGIVLLTYTILAYTGHAIVERIPSVVRCKNNKSFALGSVLLSLALMLGIVGYRGYLNAPDLRLFRIFVGSGGLWFIGSAFLKTIYTPEADSKWIRNMAQYLNVKNILTAVSVVLLSSIFLISFFDANYGGDAFMYHIPFAARIWGIIPPERYAFEYYTEHRFLGFPLLSHVLQGFFWKIFQRPEATNLLCFSSLILLLVFLKNYLKIPFYLATVTLLAVPMVHMHAARSYIDLPGNVCVSILVLMTYLLYANRITVSPKNLLVIILSAAGAANSKHQFVPVVFFILCFVFAILFFKTIANNENRKVIFWNLLRLTICSFLASLLIFATSVKNILIHQNPFYPVKVEIAGIVLNHTEAPPDFMHESLRKLPPPIRWARSVLEINAFDDRRPWRWTLGMDFIAWTEPRFGVGGYFGAYVIFNLLLSIYLCWQNWGKETKVAAVLMPMMSLFTSVLPQSYELRYYMYWAIVFVSLNAYLVCHSKSQSIVNPPNLGLVATGFMLVFAHQTHFFYTKPEFSSFAEQVQRTDITDRQFFDQIQDGDRVCIVGKAPHTFLYTSDFHPPRNYSVKAEFNIGDEKFILDQCGDRKILK